MGYESRHIVGARVLVYNNNAGKDIRVCL